MLSLHGAGASRDAGIPDSSGMLKTLDGKAKSVVAWRPYVELHLQIERSVKANARKLAKSPMPGLPVRSRLLVQRRSAPSIETYVGELRLRHEFRSGASRAHVGELTVLVLDEIKQMMLPENAEMVAYLKGYAIASRILGVPLYAGSLNYDPCMEMNAGEDFHVETGFKRCDGKHQWDGSRFTNPPNDTGRGKPSVNLLQFHGSMKWQLDELGRLVSVGISQGIDMSRAVLVLGHREKAKRKFPPPYERYKEMFREQSEISIQIVVIGYGFADEEINVLLEDAMKNENIEEVLVVGKFGGNIEREKEEIAILLGGGEKLRLVESSAKDFLESLGEKLEVVAPGVGRVRV